MTLIICSEAFCVILTVLMYLYRSHADPRKNRRLPCILILIWSAVILYLTILKRTPNGTAMQNLKIFGKMTRHYIYSETGLIMNIIVFYPLGLFLASIDIKLLIAALIGLLFSLSIEGIQLATTRGVFEINDMIANTAGTFIGALIWNIVKFISNSFKRLKRSKQNNK